MVCDILSEDIAAEVYGKIGACWAMLGNKAADPVFRIGIIQTQAGTISSTDHHWRWELWGMHFDHSYFRSTPTLIVRPYCRSGSSQRPTRSSPNTSPTSSAWISTSNADLSAKLLAIRGWRFLKLFAARYITYNLEIRRWTWAKLQLGRGIAWG